MTTEKDQPPKDQEQPPRDVSPLAPGVWATETTGFACVPPRAQSDLRNAVDTGETDCREEPASSKATDPEPRIERYPER
jgi:hypothetical protein